MPEPLASVRRPDIADQVVFGQRYRVARWRTDTPRLSRPLLFFTGIGANIELLAPFLARLRNRDVVTFDVPGIGGSPDYPRPYRLSAMADAAREILNNLGYDQTDVMGVSWGGMLAQEFAYRHAQGAGRLILAATSPGMPMIPGSVSTLFKMVTSHRYSDPGSIQSYLQRLYGGSDHELETYASRMRAPSPTGYLHQVLAIVGWTSIRKLTRVSAETLILMGADDRLVPPANGHILKFLLDKARLEILENAGHLFVLTHADAVETRVEEFLTGSQSLAPPLSVKCSSPHQAVK